MKAVVMAGGHGTRLRPLTSNQPKPMVPVVNKPTIEHILELVRRHGIDEVILTLAFLPRAISDYFGDGSSLGMHIDYTVEEVPAGTAGSILLAKELLTETFLVVSGDALTDFDLTSIVDFHRSREALVTIGLTRVQNPLEFGVVIVDEEGRIQRFLEKPGWGQVFSDTVNTGIYVIEPEVLEFIPEGRPYDFSHELFPELFEMGKPLYGMVCEGYWQDIGNLEQYLQANRDALDGRIRLTPPGVRLRDDIWVERSASFESLDGIEGPAVIGAGVKIEPGAQIGPHVVLGDNTVIRAGARVQGSVLGDNVYVAQGATIDGAILGDASQIHENAHIAQGAAIGDRSVVGRNAVVANNVKIYPSKTVEPDSTVRSSIIWETKGPSSLFGGDGVRGLANIDVTPETAMRLAMAYGSLVAQGSYIATSRDAHDVCRVFQRAIVSGLNSTGVNVRDLGVATPAITRFDIKNGAALGGVHVRLASDDPEQIEILFSEAPGVPIDGKRERAIENMYFREDFRRASPQDMGTVVYPPRILEMYTDAMVEDWDLEAIGERRPRVVLDFSGSVPAAFYAAVLERSGVGVISVNSAPPSVREGDFADSLPAAAARVGEMVRAMGADLGAILDPGAEYLYVVDEKGALVPSSALLLLLLSYVVQDVDEGTAVLPLHVTGHAEKILAHTGIEVRRTKYSAAEVMSESACPGTVFATDGEGGFIFPDVLPGMDPLTAFGTLLGLISSSGVPLSQSVAQMPEVHLLHRMVGCPWDLKGTVMRRVTEHLHEGRVSLVDGVKVHFDDGDWVLVVPDAEEASFHVYAEGGDSHRAQELAHIYEEMLGSVVKGCKT